ncbi:Predicted Peptidoglycan domain-containing protein [Flexibacter flexilis DSM 6793]|uniref:Predicted Peptidoglycan domain-containing protein n=1 Tax=Flexibacter flexilis DSM 6793 TaxID=927664 RepID=A0A1I1M5I6_9BACT|nr:glycosyl hydrolase 108 family protein [Flexibacter flexilis]SFC80699.1 Predicted Peptidoglycan domain-containing protein [Flexibacter flexilis DSM 6793]
MANHVLAFQKTLKWEGGFQNLPNDTANYCDGKLIGTNMGVSAIGYKQYFGRCPTVAEIKAISQETAANIFKKNYWDKVKGDQIKNQSVAELLADWAWGSGPVTAVRKAQQALGLTADGVIGQKTLAALNAKDSANTFVVLHKAREEHFRAIAQASASKAGFLDGWLNRLNDFVYSPDGKKPQPQ